jgi:hypothetical protein
VGIFDNIKKKEMPELFRMFGIRFFFFANEHLPIHVHVKNADGEAKFNIGATITLITNSGMKNKDIYLAQSLIEENEDLIVKRWNEFFKQD